MPPDGSPTRRHPAASRPSGTKAYVFDILEGTGPTTRARRWFNAALIFLIVTNVSAVAIETVDEVRTAYQGLFDLFETVSVAIFLVEYLLRLWVAELHPPLQRLGRFRARLRYAIDPAALVDLLAILPYFLFLFGVGGDLRVLRILRLFRFLKLARYSPGLRSLANVVADEKHALLGALVVMTGLALLAASGMYLVERHVQPEAFGSIPLALWWALATLTTVGYGDVVPITVAGRLLGSVVMVFGLVVFAAPVGIVATAFAREMHARDFVVTWGLVSRVPLFAELSASEIADVVRLLHARKFRAGTVIVERGEPAYSMFFITSGEVEIRLDDSVTTLGEGAHFGEIAVLGTSSIRAATVVAISDVDLLELDAAALHRLMDRNPRIAREIEQNAAEHLFGRRVSPRADIAEQELSEQTKP